MRRPLAARPNFRGWIVSAWSVLRRRPLVARPYFGAWIVFAWSVYVGSWSYDVSLRPPGFGGVTDRRNYDVYHYAAEAYLAGADFYAVVPPGLADMFTYLYPPITVVAFVPFTYLEPAQGYVVFTAITLAACAAATAAIVSYVEGWFLTLGWIDVTAIWLFFVASTHSTGTINFGNVNLLLAAGIVFGFFALERGREFAAGAFFGAVALMKVFPAIVGLYLLRIRAWRAIAGAIAVGGGGLLASVVVFDLATLRRFFVEVLGDRSELDLFVGGYPPDETYYVTIQRPLSHLLWRVWPDAPKYALPILAAVVLASILAYCYLDLKTQTDRLVAIHATLTAAVVLMPALRWYLALLFFSWVALLYVWHDSPLLLPFGAGGIVAGVPSSPETMLGRVEGYPAPFDALLEPLYAVGTLQLYGLLLMLAACVLYKWRQGVGLRYVVEAGRRLRGETDRGVGRSVARRP